MVDLTVLLAILLGTGAAVRRLRRRGARRRALLLAGWAAFQGVALVAMMTAHSVEILYHLAAGHDTFAGTPWTYDFRTYSLLLLGAVLGAQGGWFLSLAPGLGAGDPEARRAAVRAKLVLLATVLPIVPVHAFFGVILGTMGGVGLLMLLVARPELAHETPAAARHLSAVPIERPAARTLALVR